MDEDEHLLASADGEWMKEEAGGRREEDSPSDVDERGGYLINLGAKLQAGCEHLSNLI